MFEYRVFPPVPLLDDFLHQDTFAEGELVFVTLYGTDLRSDGRAVVIAESSIDTPSGTSTDVSTKLDIGTALCTAVFHCDMGCQGHQHDAIR
jgi:hypothetical protein